MMVLLLSFFTGFSVFVASTIHNTCGLHQYVAEVMSVAISVVNIFVCSGDEFAVVVFPEEDCSLGIVHKSWLNEDHDKTLWPNAKNPTKRRRLTVQAAAPTEAWIEVKCIVKAWAGKSGFCIGGIFSQQAKIFFFRLV